MKKYILFGVAVSLLLIAGGTARAEEKDGVETTASIKSWFNEWKRDVPGAGSRTSDRVVLVGPAVEVEFRQGPVIEASYLVSASDYRFTEAGMTTEIDRRDLDLAVGKWFDHYVGFYVGYRNSSFKEEQTGAKDSSYGLFYRLAGSCPLVGTSSLYADLTWLDTRFKAEGLAREDAPGWIAELGGKVPFSERFAMKVGYKWETTKGKDSQIKDTFTGVRLDLAYLF